MKRKIIFIFLTLVLMISILTISVNAALSGYASSIGTTYNNINTQASIERAANMYSIFGYSPSFHVMDPSYITRLSNLSAKVQFFNEHGNVTLIRGSKSGIRVSNDVTSNGAEYIGTNNINSWSNANTVLVTYVACLTAGDGSLDTGSLTYETAVRGAQITLGFKESIGTTSAAEWANNYNTRLADGYGVYDAAEFANAHTYTDSRVKNWHIVHHGDANLDLAGNSPTPYSSIRRTTEDINSKNILNKLNKNIDLKESNISNIITNVNDKFDINDYEITRTEGAGVTNLLTGETTNKEYIDLKLKVGDFVTKSGYVVELENGNIQSIFDNTIKSSKLNAAIQNTTNLKISSSDKNFQTKKYTEDAINQIKNNTPEEFEVKITKTETSYYYDIETDKKYFVVTVSSELIKDDYTTLSEDPIYFEIN